MRPRIYFCPRPSAVCPSVPVVDRTRRRHFRLAYPTKISGRVLDGTWGPAIVPAVTPKGDRRAAGAGACTHVLSHRHSRGKANYLKSPAAGHGFRHKSRRKRRDICQTPCPAAYARRVSGVSVSLLTSAELAADCPAVYVGRIGG